MDSRDRQEDDILDRATRAIRETPVPEEEDAQETDRLLAACLAAVRELEPWHDSGITQDSSQPTTRRDAHVPTELADGVSRETYPIEQPPARRHVARRFVAMLERMTVQRRLVKAVAGLAACAAVIAAVWIGVGGSDAQRVFAAAIDRVTQARTFYCRTTSEFVKQDGQKEVWETVYMFKEPDLERIEYKAGLPHPGEVHITDYGKRRHLSLHPDDKSAALEDISSAFAVDDRTGNLHLTRLSTGERDQLLSLSAMAVESLEDTELDGQSVRVLQARQPKRIITAWIRPETGLPVQLAIELPEQQRRVLWTSIRIDEELDDALFSVEPPAGYTLFKGGLYKPGPEDTMKLMAKMMHLLRACHVYRERNNDQFPRELGELTNLKAVGISAEALKTILAAPDQPDGPPVILYRQPREGREWGKEIALYQAFDEWPANGLIAVGFADGHCGVISRERFEELMR